MDDISKAVTMDFKRQGNAIMVVGITKDEMGGSHYWDINGFVGNSVPTVDVGAAKKTMLSLHTAMDKRLIESCHDCSEGGIGVALAEMAFAGEVGADVDLTKIPAEDGMRDDHILFSESNSRFIIEVTPGNVTEVSTLLGDVPSAVIGKTTDTNALKIEASQGTVVDENIFDLKEAWQAPLRSV